ncbi:MAG: TIGR03435 family protein [Bryobacteraceae bacterium]|jgi:hypothetical protein
MNAIQMLGSEPWVERLGWTLVHFFWQGALIAVLYAAARRWIERRSSPNARYLLACAALATMMAAPVATWSTLGPSNEVTPPANRTSTIPAAAFPAPAPTDPDHANVYAALQEQLGLKLGSAKGPVEVLVIDRVERPGEN